MATSEGIPSSIDIQFLELNDNPYVEMLKDVVDHWIIDIKDMNPHIYKAYTGKDNKQVISNLQYLIDNNAKITARVPLIAGFNTELDVKKSILSP